MKILFIEWSSCGKKDLVEAFIKEGHELIYPPFSIEGKTYQELPEIERQFSSVVREEAPDLVYTTNYYPAISNLCCKENVRYISWLYDSPYRRLFSESVLNPCNIIYVFDKQLYLECHNAGISTVRYMPLAANTERLDAIQTDGYTYDVSFVGSLYLENGSAFVQVLNSVSDYTKGYLNALVAAQLKIQGYNFIEEVLGPVIGDMARAYPMTREPGGIESQEYFYAQYVVNEWITAVDRIDLLETVARECAGVDLFTQHKDFSASNVRNHGTVDYYEEMPKVFKQSRINLNITRRGIQSGIPLRAVDIMGSGGFLVSNFQSDFLDYFIPGEDFVYYESKEDLQQKIDYYLNHEEERRAIAKRGHDKIAAGHTYRHRIREMLSAL
ncbi:hypothetical protein E5357_09525 [Hominisplanchenecus murintestinalis]|uniref:Uncharacterized protein n=1 Tax=Hominisplanchenecus murintestinalis TaxID=2941517 RepID=A0AC61QZ40_9FIRM|nr:glycosyltransferase [Hominisplanchenecus murintestinalis]TGX98314.1 hypothetical protein E5357_09525 [Hominisplanchenecus murintestinalis]